MLGNITLITKGQADGQGNKTGSSSGYRSYEYDDLNQLVRENNKTTNETYVYTYDNYGNITSKEIHSLLGTDSEPSESTRKDTITYSYGTNGDAGWSKLLTNYNGEAISYDAIGNPTSYRGATLTWDGRELKKYVEGNTTVTYKYDADGLRSSKTVGNKTSTYQYVDGQLLYEDRNGNDIYYYYDSYGTPTAIVYCSASGSTNTVYIATNSLGDVIGLYNPSGEMIVKYEYDAWGKVVAETDANGNALTGSAKTWSEINPFRYRGYYYDSETELYYLQSRYYDAEVGRFINSDSQLNSDDLLGFNSYAYCNNNPVMHTDPTGHGPWLVFAFIVVSCVVGAVIGYFSDEKLWETADKNSKSNKGTVAPNNTPTFNYPPSSTFPGSDPLPENKPLPQTNPLPSEKKVELTGGDRMKNAIIGASMGLLVSGSFASAFGAISSVVVGSATKMISFLGATGAQTFAIGALAYNAVVMLFLPILGIEMEPIEYS